MSTVVWCMHVYCCVVCAWQTVGPHSVHDAACRFTQEELLAIDLEGRCVITDHEAFILFNLYGPAITSEENAAERLAYKMRLYQVMFNCHIIASMLKGQTTHIQARGLQWWISECVDPADFAAQSLSVARHITRLNNNEMSFCLQVNHSAVISTHCSF